MPLIKPSADTAQAASAGPPPALADLLAQLGGDDAAHRRHAAQALAAHEDAAPGLAARLEAETDASVRAVIFSSLARIGGAGAAQVLLPLLRSQDAALRNGAIEALAVLPEAVAPRMQALLADADSDVRIFAVNLLGQLPHPQVPLWLAQVLDEDPHPNVIGAALEVAAEIAGPDLAEPLRGAAARFPADPFVAFAAGLVLRRIESA